VSDSMIEGNSTVVELAVLRKRFDLLTPRQREVMAHVVQGRRNKQIAGELGISEMTVKIHRFNAKRKMRANSLPDLVRMADKLAMNTGTLIARVDCGAAGVVGIEPQ
jgi:FixJ family two-component response regulator